MCEGQRKVFLFLQGPPTGFWHKLAEALKSAGHQVLKVAFCPSDVLFWSGSDMVSYRGPLAGWSDWLDSLMSRTGVTDLIYYGDRMPYHAMARAQAANRGVTPWVMEFGYLRPDWLVLERSGMGADSGFPREPEKIRALAAIQNEPDLTVRYTMSFSEEAVGEVAFHLGNSLLWPFFPRYKADRHVWPVRDYLAWLPEFLRHWSQQRHATAVQTACQRGDWPYVVFALQLESDYQIRGVSHYEHQEYMLRDVLVSMSGNASADLRLVVKIHPLDNGLDRWPKRLARVAKATGTSTRIEVIKGGNLESLLKNSNGLIVFNSTTGIHALRKGVPCLAMGNPVYNAPGLTHQTGLEQFWRTPESPDASLVKDFVRALGSVQIKGSFYNRAGQTAAIAAAVERLNAQ